MDAWKQLFRDETARSAYESYVSGWEEKIRSFLRFDPDTGLGARERFRDRGEQSPSGPADTESLTDIPFAVKDNIAVEGFPLTCGSKILEKFESPYTATAVEKLLRAGAIPVGKTNMDEFGMGSSTDNSALGKTNNPWDTGLVAGGSSGGSAAAVAAGLVPFALGSDTGGSIRQPAAFCGVYGLKPTYGTVSRYGLVAYASSLEGIGVVTAGAGLLERVYACIRGRDPRDHSSLDPPGETRAAEKRPVRTIGVFDPRKLDMREEVRGVYRLTIERFEKLGYNVREIEIPALEYTVPAYYTIAMAEASSNLARYNGIRYGYRAKGAETYEEMVMRSRSEGFGPEVKLRILLGTYVLRSGFQDQYYLRAQKIRTAIRNGFDASFGGVDLILMPVYPTNAFPHGEGGLDPFEQKLADKFTGAANLAGIPALAFPAGLTGGGIPSGMQLMAPPFEEGRLFAAARRWEEAYPPPRCPGCAETGKWGESRQ
ncbi:MAG: Asp-tRNA(Asn)/Glu-tRNA(Gln) amidotransferase subunit GatA [Spirochaetia bacterium]